ncbi:MAG: DegT/DnrJ/EryC1/StrS family aminotransferase [Caldilineaceae bacterium]
MSDSANTNATLAINGGTPAKQHPDPPMYPGGMAIAEEEEAAVLEVLRAKRLFRYYGPGDKPSKVAALEEAFCVNKGARYSVAVTSGTAALTCALHGIGIGPGDEVILPADTCIASAAAVVAAGGIPVVAEIDESLLLIRPMWSARSTIHQSDHAGPYARCTMPHGCDHGGRHATWPQSHRGCGPGQWGKLSRASLRHLWRCWLLQPAIQQDHYRR